MIQIYLQECHHWSDGGDDDDHEEDHNLYYDTKFFYIINKPDYACLYTWNAYSGNINTGLITEWSYRMHLEDIKNSQPCETISRDLAIQLINRELNRLKERCRFVRGSLYEPDPRELCEKVEQALLTF
jgi:hypothetical protein